MQPFIAEKKEQIAELCRTHHVRRLAVFGSALGERFNEETSDVDVLVEFSEVPVALYSNNKWELYDGLVAILGRKVDLVTWKYIKNPYFKKEVEQSHEMLYAA